MAYIEPNSTIKILQNVPLDTTYKHTIFFGNNIAQSNFFDTKVKYTLTKQSYQRKERGYMRVQLKADNLYNCNYLMYQNTSFGNKWFYAFITSVEYINNEVSEIGFEIDVMQTWFFDVTLLDSYVEREHSATDKVGDNIVAEPVQVNDMYTGPMLKAKDVNGNNIFNTYACILVSPYKRFPPTVSGARGSWKPAYDGRGIDPVPVDPVLPPTVDNQVQGVFYTVLKSPSTIATAISELTDDGGKINDVIALYPVPSVFVNEYADYDVLDGNTKTFDVTYYLAKPTTLGLYVPRNKKLLTYPYNKFVIDTGTGVRNEYPFEYFNSDDITFKLYGNILQNVAFKLVPCKFKSVAENENNSFPTLLSDFPLTSFSIDAFKAWYAQNKTSVALQTVGAIGTMYSGFIGGMSEVLAGSQMLTPVRKQLSKPGADRMAKGYEKAGKASAIGGLGLGAIISNLITRNQAPMEVKGTADGCLEIAIGTKDFNGVQYYLNPSDAKIIDDFFSMYGYAVKRIKKPNRSARPYWTYVKTIDCNVEGNAPADDVEKICSIYDSGITFWRNGNAVGEYLNADGTFKDNSPYTN